MIKMSLDTGGFSPLPEGTYQLTYTGGTGNEPATVNIRTCSDSEHTPLSSTDWYGNSFTTEWAIAQVRVAAGQTVTIEGLPEGIAYDIVEVPVTNYTVTATAVNGTVASDGSVYSPYYIIEDAAATFTNTYTPPEGRDLTITKLVTGNIGDTNREFPFSITLTDQSGSPLSDLDITMLLPDQTERVCTTDANGGLTVSLKHGQTVTLQNLPQGTQYTITETEPGRYITTFVVTGGSYQPAGEHTQSGALDGEGNVVVEVTNQLNFVVPTGIRTEIKPVVIVAGFAFALGFLLLTGDKRRSEK
jgi:hypothetical protein